MGGFRPNPKAEGEGIRSATKFEQCFRGCYGGQFLTLRCLSASGRPNAVPEMKGQAMTSNSMFKRYSHTDVRCLCLSADSE